MGERQGGPNSEDLQKKNHLLELMLGMERQTKAFSRDQIHYLHKEFLSSSARVLGLVSTGHLLQFQGLMARH